MADPGQDKPRARPKPRASSIRKPLSAGGGIATCEVDLAKKEFTLLRVLASDPTRVFSEDELLRDVWGFRTPAGKTRTLDSHASRLRRKLDPEHQRCSMSGYHEAPWEWDEAELERRGGRTRPART